MDDKDKINVMDTLRPTTEVMTSFHNTLSRSIHFPARDDTTPEFMNKQLDKLIKLTTKSLEKLQDCKGKL